MSLQTSLCSYLEADAGVAALVGTRIYPLIPKGATLPYVIYSRSSVKRYPVSSGSTGLVTTVVRLVSFADHYGAAVEVAEALRDALDGKTGTVGDQSFEPCQLVAESDNIDPVEFAQNSAPYFVAQEYQITHRETVPSLGV